MKCRWILPVLLLGACGGEPVTETHRQDTAHRSTAAVLVPPYPGAVEVELPNFGAPGTDTRSGNATASETDDGPEQVAQFYRESFAGADVAVHVDTVGADGGMMGIGRDGEQGAMLTITRTGDKTRISVVQQR